MHAITFSHRESMEADYGLSHSSSSLLSFYTSSLLSYKIVGYQVLCENHPEFNQSFPDYGLSVQLFCVEEGLTFIPTT